MEIKKEKTTHGFGLAIFSLILLALAFTGILSGKKICVVASVISMLSVIFAIASFVEARRANGTKKFALIAVLLSLLGAYFILSWTGTFKKIPFLDPEQTEQLIPPVDTNINDATTLIEKAERLEKDTVSQK